MSVIKPDAQSSDSNAFFWKDYQLKVNAFTEFNQTLSAVEIVEEFAILQPQKASSQPVTVEGYD